MTKEEKQQITDALDQCSNRLEAADYENLGRLFAMLGEHDKAQEYLEKALRIRKELCNRNGEASCYAHLGALFLSLRKYPKADK